VQNVPPFQDPPFAGGIAGFAFNLLYDPAVVNVTSIAPISATSLIASGTDFIPWSFSEPPPDSDGNLKVVELDLSTTYESGDGVLIRITFAAVGTGTSPLILGDEASGTTVWADDDDGNPAVYHADAEALPLASNQSGQIVVGDSCLSPTPSSTPAPTNKPKPTHPQKPSHPPKPTHPPHPTPRA
jgi:hypothetical protein